MRYLYRRNRDNDDEVTGLNNFLFEQIQSLQHLKHLTISLETLPEEDARRLIVFAERQELRSMVLLGTSNFPGAAALGSAIEESYLPHYGV